MQREQTRTQKFQKSQVETTNTEDSANTGWNHQHNYNAEDKFQ